MACPATGVSFLIDNIPNDLHEACFIMSFGCRTDKNKPGGNKSLNSEEVRYEKVSFC